MPGHDPWLVVGRRGRARPAADAVTRPPPALADDWAAPPAPLEPEAAPRRARRAAHTPPDLAAAVSGWEPSIAAAGWWAGLARAMAAATRAASAAVEVDEDGGGGREGGGGGGGGGQPPFPWADAAGLVVLGLGSLEGPSPGAARAQAALARLLARHLTELKGRKGAAASPFRLVAADPAFTASDVAALASLGFEVAPPAGALAVLRPAGQARPHPPPAPWVAYLPHCEAGLTEAVLAAAGVGVGGGVGGEGGSSHPPATVALIANSLAGLADRWSCALPNGRGGRAADPHGSARPARALGLVEAGRVVEVGLVAVRAEGGRGSGGGGGGGGGGAGAVLSAAFGDTALHLFLPSRAS